MLIKSRGKISAQIYFPIIYMSAYVHVIVWQENAGSQAKQKKIKEIIKNC